MMLMDHQKFNLYNSDGELNSVDDNDRDGVDKIGLDGLGGLERLDVNDGVEFIDEVFGGVDEIPEGMSVGINGMPEGVEGMPEGINGMPEGAEEMHERVHNVGEESGVPGGIIDDRVSSDSDDEQSIGLDSYFSEKLSDSDCEMSNDDLLFDQKLIQMLNGGE
ncbi:hypothetical protein BUALT_Bualt09G0030400 [Buddleja alternifolia]|uniref:Uncharacterized protein n=1 Tax=Buddleja alternifolia TaxID=168488 RepID=A0AAV6WYS3_9LAMI|nr:hypothetical protein BUALT_Bualt09G0030400 [Buddleja alternifolia]